MMRSLSLLWVFLLLFNSCKREEKHKDINVASDNRVLVLNEGNFMWSNASFDVLDKSNWQLNKDPYKAANGKTLGDVLQSGAIYKGVLWLVLNNSGKIVGLDTATYKEKWSMNGLGSPRYLAFANDMVWVTDIYSGKISVYNANSKVRAAQIKVGVWCEQIINDGEYMSVACTDGWLRRFDTLRYRIADSVFAGKNLQKLSIDNKKRIWALASDSGRSNILVYDAALKKSKWLKTDKSFSGITMSRHRDSVVLLGSGVAVMSADAESVPDAFMYTDATANFYGLGCDAQTGLIYIADAADYVSQGWVIVIDSKGNIYKRLKAGIIPSGFIFY